MKKYLLSILFFLQIIAFAKAQTGLMGYGSNALIPAQMANPALVGTHRFHLSVPALSSVQVQMNNSFKMTDWLTTTGSSTKVDFNKFNAVAQAKNTVGACLSADVFNFGFRVADEHYFSAGLQANAYARASFSDDLVKLFAEGNYKNPNLELVHESVYLLSYAAAYVGYARTMLEGRFKWGVHGKYISGLGHADTEGGYFSIKTDPTSSPAYALEVSGQMTGRGAGLFALNMPAVSDKYNYGKGFGIDLGASLQLSEKIEVAASVTNLGVINWSSDHAGFIATKGKGVVNFKGETVQIGVKNSSNRSSLDSTWAEIQNVFSTKTMSDAYVTRLPAAFYGSASFKANDRHAAILLLRGQFFNGNLDPMAGLKYQFTPKRWLQLMTGVSWMGGSRVGFGAGMVLSPGPIQLHILADNVAGFYLDNTRFAQVQVGLNVLLKKKKEIVAADEPVFR